VTINLKHIAQQHTALLFVAMSAALLAACASKPPPVVEVAAPVATPVVPTVPPRTTALLALGFEKADEGYVLNLPGPLLFGTGSDVLSDAATAVIVKLAADVRALGIESVRLYGHTDNVGSAEFNRGLSTKRAEAVAVAMMGQGFASNALERRGFGFDRPIASNDTPEGRTKNRRVAVIVPFE
jgi:outer membrane protein OmpA-like peptidoglycan-associated protein